MTLLPTLDEIGVRCGTDKSSLFHHYLGFYNELLSGRRLDPVALLEIGVLGGESIRMWGEFFSNPKTRIYGVDIEDRPLPQFDERTSILITDATSPNSVHDITKVSGPLDIIVDDGSHYSAQQIDALRHWWPHLKPGGVFIVEDVFTSFTYPWTIPDSESFVDHTLKWIKDCHENGKDHCGVSSSELESIHIRKGVHVFTKAK